MNLKVPGAILPHGCAILSTRAKTVRGLVQPPLGELGLKYVCLLYGGASNFWNSPIPDNIQQLARA